MKTFILVPIDFTSESLHAVQYARTMAHTLNMGIALLHIHEPLLDPVTGSAFDAEMERIARKKLEEVVADLWIQEQKDKISIPIESHFESGFVESGVLDLIQEEAYSYIVMASRTNDIFLKRLLGSVSIRIGRKSHKPVIVVPESSSPAFPSHVVVGMSPEVATSEVLTQISSFFDHHPAEVDFVYVTDNEIAYVTLQSHLRQKVEEMKIRSFTSKYYSLTGGIADIEERLLSFAMDRQADMMILVTSHHTFLESLLIKSTTARALRHPKIPVMILHHQVESESHTTVHG